MSFAITNCHICSDYLTTFTLLDGWIQTSTTTTERIKTRFTIQTAAIAASDERSYRIKRLFF
jgi:hypothetical protein